MASAEQKAEMMRRFVRAAPPGQLLTVLKALKTLVADNAFFMQHAPSLALDYHTRNYATVEGKDGAFVVSEFTHMEPWAEALAPAVAASLRAAELDPAVFGSFVFADWGRAAVHVVDPLCLTSAAVLPLRDALSLLPPDVAPLLRGFADATAVESPEVTRAALGLSFTAPLVDALANYAQQRYTDGATNHVGAAPAFGAAGADVRFGINAERTSAGGAWCGRWVTSASVTFVDAATGEPIGATMPAQIKALVKGTAAVGFHYHEQGNTQMEADFPVDLEADLPPGADESCPAAAATALATTALTGASVGDGEAQRWLQRAARRLVALLEAAEDEVQQEVLAACGPALSDDAMKRLRRRLPVTKQTFDFAAPASSQRVFTAERPKITAD